MAPRMRMACVLSALLLTSCGGSSSETPPPLEPDPSSYRYTGPRLPRADDDEAQSAPEPEAEIDEDDLPPEQKPKPAQPTWGSGRPRSAPVTSATAPAPSATPPAPPASAVPPVTPSPQ